MPPNYLKFSDWWKTEIYIILLDLLTRIQGGKSGLAGELLFNINVTVLARREPLPWDSPVN